MSQDVVKIIPLSSFDTSSLSGTYQVINSTGLPHACFLIRINNDSNMDITVSFDGTTDQEFVSSNSSLTLPFQSNSSPNGFVAKMAKGTKVYVKGSSGMGSVYLSGYYQL